MREFVETQTIERRGLYEGNQRRQNGTGTVARARR